METEQIAPDGPRVGFFPGDRGTSRWGREIHPWSALATTALEGQGCAIQFLDKQALCNLPRRPSFDVLHLNWPQALTSPESYKRRKYMPHGWYRRWFMANVDRLLRNLDAVEVPVVWQVHDLPYSNDERMFELHKHVFDRFFARADGLLFYERSAQEPVFEMHGQPGTKAVGIAHLGGYTEMHGPAIGREEARRRLGIENARHVFLYAGTVRWSRKPVTFMERFIELASERDLLIVTGRGTEALAREHAHDRVLFKPGMVEHGEFRDLICACDYVINDAARYLGSAIIRVALGYGVPVIARSFGCTADIARGAYIPVEESPEGLDDALKTALSLPDEDYREMKRQALQRHEERPWSAYAQGCLSVYRQVASAWEPRVGRQLLGDA